MRPYVLLDLYIPSTSVKLTEFNVESDGRDTNFCVPFAPSPFGLRANAIRSLSLTSAKDSVSDLAHSPFSFSLWDKFYLYVHCIV